MSGPYPVQSHPVDQQSGQLLVLNLNGLQVGFRNAGAGIQTQSRLDMDRSETELEKMRHDFRKVNRVMAEGGPRRDPAGTPRDLFQVRLQPMILRNRWLATPDGERFLFLQPQGTTRSLPMTVVLNWAEALPEG